MRKLIYALRFMTILPIPWKEDEDLVQVSRSSGYFPIVGLIIGVLLGFTGFLSSKVLSSSVTALLQTVLWVFLTGGLHLDGLSDTFDGIGSNRDRERMLEIMKDSSIGAFGAIALILQLLFKYVLIKELNAFSPWLIIIPPVTARWGQIISIFFFQSARPDGMGKFFKDYIRFYELLFAIISTVCIYVLLLPVTSLGILVIHGFSVLLISGNLSKKLGGLTGDVYGLICETGETLTLFLLLVFYSFKTQPAYSQILNKLVHLLFQ